MSHFDRSLRSQFFLTGPRPCPYLPHRRERKLFTNLVGPDAGALHDDLAAQGFRRSQNIAYRPACGGCSACVSTRVRAFDFAPTRSQRRVINRNADLVRSACDPWATEEQYELFARYLGRRHAEGGMTDMDLFDFAAMIEDTPVRTHVMEYRLPAEDETGSASGGAPDQDPYALDAEIAGAPADPLLERPRRPGGRLVAACVTDVLRDGLSLVYSFFEPGLDRRSLGQHIILDHIDLARRAGLPFVYLGYWVPGSEKMDYKIRFQPSETLTERGWRLCDLASQD